MFYRLQHTGKLNDYGFQNPKTWRDNDFIDCGLKTEPGIINKSLFTIVGSGVHFIDNRIHYSTPQNLDYIFLEQSTSASSSTPNFFQDNKFSGYEPVVRTFGLNSSQYHRLIGNIGVKESSIQAVFSSSRTPSSPQAYLGVG